MIKLTLNQIAEITGGQAFGDPEKVVTGNVEFDSRNVGPGDLFVALAGARVDGHDFASQVSAKGAAGVLAFRKVDANCVVVPPVTTSEGAQKSYALEHDSSGAVAAVLAAMGKIARCEVDALVEHGLVVVGVTGSAGKTSTKDMMASVFSAAGPTVAPPGSFNNEIGHPYTALKCTEETKYLVAEMSARGVGHVAHLAQIAPPHIGVVLNVGTAHVGEFGSKEIIAQAKGELVEALPESGVAVLNYDDPFVAPMSQRTSAQRVITFSAVGAHDATVRAVDVELDELARASFTLEVDNDAPRKVSLAVSGQHQVANALAAVGAGVAAGLDLDVIVAALNAHGNASAHRMDVRRSASGLTVIDDAYNANPESMRAGIDALVATATKRERARSIAVLGPMGELGDDAVAQHGLLAQYVADKGVDVAIAVGDDAQMLEFFSQATERGVEVHTVLSNKEAADLVAKLAQDNDVVLVKASNSYKLWEVADMLS